ncbi:MAG: response regulator [Gallionella sp.]|nr:response regulator [Gallionella sp.]
MKRILIVDDEPHITRVLKLYLGRAGYAVDTAENGQAGLDAIVKNVPDVLFTDIQMPVMTGKQLCFALEEQYPQRTFPVFVMTSMTDREHREWTQQISNLQFLEKPLSMRAMTHALNKYFDAAVVGEGASHV